MEYLKIEDVGGEGRWGIGQPERCNVEATRAQEKQSHKKGSRNVHGGSLQARNSIQEEEGWRCRALWSTNSAH